MQKENKLNANETPSKSPTALSATPSPEAKKQKKRVRKEFPRVGGQYSFFFIKRCGFEIVPGTDAAAHFSFMLSHKSKWSLLMNSCLRTRIQTRVEIY